MQNKNVRGIIALALVTALSFGVIFGSKQLAQNNGGNASQSGAAEDVKVVAELDVNGAENIEKAVQTENGYMVTVKTAGYGGDIVMNVSFDQDAKTITSVEVLEQSETENLGALIAEDEFLSQFAGAVAPVYLPGMTLETETDNTKTENTEVETETEAPALVDGTYEAKGEPDSKGYYDVMTMTVEGGKITSVVWDCLDAEGNKKSVMSEDGRYVMTEDGPTWRAQAEALAAALVSEQDLAFFTMDEKGKTDAVSGVSIAIGGFVNMAQECLDAASGKKAPALVDGTYEAKGEPDSKGYYDVMTMTVEGGKITSVVWDCLDAEGNKKSVMSEDGRYVMTEDGPTWRAQAEALAAALVSEQDLAFFTMDEKGKTDAVSGVSIAIGGFVNMAQECLEQAAPAAEKKPVLKDGTYEAKGEPDSKGYYDVMTMTVEGGKITSVVWDCLDAEGNKKSVMSEDGRYVMTEDGPTWRAQAEALAAALVSEQDLAFFTMDEKGKTDAVSGVSIAIGGFVNMAQECLAAAGEEVTTEDTASEETAASAEEAAPQNGTQVDAVSGATVSSTAAVKGINAAYNFLQSVK